MALVAGWLAGVKWQLSAPLRVATAPVFHWPPGSCNVHLEALTDLVTVSVFKTDVAPRERRLGEFDSRALPRSLHRPLLLRTEAGDAARPLRELRDAVIVDLVHFRRPQSPAPHAPLRIL